MKKYIRSKVRRSRSKVRRRSDKVRRSRSKVRRSSSKVRRSRSKVIRSHDKVRRSHNKVRRSRSKVKDGYQIRDDHIIITRQDIQIQFNNEDIKNNFVKTNSDYNIGKSVNDRKVYQIEYQFNGKVYDNFNTYIIDHIKDYFTKNPDHKSVKVFIIRKELSEDDLKNIKFDPEILKELIDLYKKPDKEDKEEDKEEDEEDDLNNFYDVDDEDDLNNFYDVDDDDEDDINNKLMNKKVLPEETSILPYTVNTNVKQDEKKETKNSYIPISTLSSTINTPTKTYEKTPENTNVNINTSANTVGNNTGNTPAKTSEKESKIPDQASFFNTLKNSYNGMSPRVFNTLIATFGIAIIGAVCYYLSTDPKFKEYYDDNKNNPKFKKALRYFKLN